MKLTCVITQNRLSLAHLKLSVDPFLGCICPLSHEEVFSLLNFGFIIILPFFIVFFLTTFVCISLKYII